MGLNSTIYDRPLGSILQERAHASNIHKAEVWFSSKQESIVRELEQAADKGQFEFVLEEAVFPTVYESGDFGIAIIEVLENFLKKEGIQLIFDEDLDKYVIYWRNLG